MNESDIYRTSYQRVSRDKTVPIPITFGELEKIIAEFRRNTIALKEFHEYAQMWRAEPDRIPPSYQFWEILRELINRFVSIDCEGATFPPDPGSALEAAVLEELLRREGIDVDWSPK